ncbi:Tyrosine recombinase XerC [subsurface metagenome]
MINNQKIAKEYIASLINPRSTKKNIQTGVNIILGYLKEKCDNKSLFDIEIKDVKNFNQYLNDAENYTLTTKKSIFGTVKRFIESFLEDNIRYFSKNIKPIEITMFFRYLNKKPIWEKKIHKQSERNKEDIMSIEEYEQIIRHFQRKDIRKSYMFRILAETGMRRGELISIDIKTRINNHIEYLEDDLDKRLLRTTGKNSEVIGDNPYPISKELANDLKIHLDTRKKMNVETKAFFVSTWKKRFCPDTINKILKTTMRVLGLNEQYTPHIFRKTTNRLRKDLGANNEERAILLNQKSSNVNFDDYILKLYKWNEILEKFDKYNPYKNLIF